MLLAVAEEVIKKAAEEVPDKASGVFSFLPNINWSQPTWDLFIGLFFVLAAILYGFSLGRDRIIVILVSIYMALAVVNTAPAEVKIQNFVLQIAAFWGLFVILFFLLSRTALMKTLGAGAKAGNFFQVIIFSVLHVGLLVSITLSFLPEAAAAGLSQTAQTLFVNDLALFIWIIAPILAMVVLIRGGGEEKK